MDTGRAVLLELPTVDEGFLLKREKDIMVGYLILR